VTEQRYASHILNLYRLLPDTPTQPRQADRAIVSRLFKEGVPIEHFQAALLLGSARRTCRDPELQPLDPIKSIAYFIPVLKQLPDSPPPDGYLDYLRCKLKIT
jgi:hypothetical protein